MHLIVFISFQKKKSKHCSRFYGVFDLFSVLMRVSKARFQNLDTGGIEELEVVFGMK